MPYLLDNEKKILVFKYNSDERKQKLFQKYPRSREYASEEDIFNALKDNEKEILANLFFNPLYEVFNNYFISGIKDSLSKEIVEYMNSHKKLKIIYNFQPEYNNSSYDIIKEAPGCKIVSDGEFIPTEYNTVLDFLNEDIDEGDEEYDNFYKRKLFKPFHIIDAIFKNIHYDSQFVEEFISAISSNDYLSLLEQKNINIDFKRFFMKTDYFKNYIESKLTPENIYNLLNSELVERIDFFDLYNYGCSLLKIAPQNIEYANGYNEYFQKLIFDAFKTIDVGKNVSLYNFSPSENNIQKKVNGFKNRLAQYDKQKVALSNRLINNLLNKYRDLLTNTIRYKKYCDLHKLDVTFFDIDDILMSIAKIEAIRYETEEITVNLSDILESKTCIYDLLEKGMDYVLTYTYINEETKKEIISTIPDSPEKEYPSARDMKRHFIIHYGPTNSGKTYQAIEKLKSSNSGVYLGPLRLLALEIQDKLNTAGTICSLLTGEEEEIIPNAQHVSSTVEKLDTTKLYDVCVIDECQMIGDPERGFAWTKAILGVLAKEVYLCTGPEALELLIKLIELCGDTYELIEHKRRSELVVQPPIKFTKENIEAGDAFIVFSKKKVLAVAAELIKMGVKTSMIYGNLPYSVRKKQVDRFLNGETEVIVSTNAIGMGMNLPVRRIIFMEDKKFNGKMRDDLTISDIKQIAGRAGRNKETGYVTTTLDSNKFIKNKIFAETPKVDKAYLGFSDEIISTSENSTMADILKVWKNLKPGIGTSDTGEITSFAKKEAKIFKKMNIDRYIILDEKIYLNVKRKDKLKMVSIAFDDGNPLLMAQWKQYCFDYEAGEQIKRPVLEGVDLNDYENYYQQLELYYAFSRNFNYDIDLQWLNEEKAKISDKINEILVKEAGNFIRRCPVCQKILPWNHQHRTCKRCYYLGYN